MKKIILGLIWLSSIVIAGCWYQKEATNTFQTTKTVKIGVIAPLSGPAASIWEDAVNTFKMARDEFNLNNKNTRIELIIEDWKCDGKNATSAAQKLVNIDQVKIILWWVCSSETLAASKVTEPAWVVLISAVSSSPEISKSKNYTYRFYSDINQAATIKNYLDKHSIKKIALIYENTDYWVWFANALINVIGEENIMTKLKFNTEEKDFSPLAKQVTNNKSSIDAIIYWPNSDSSSINILRAFEKEGLIKYFTWRILTNEVWYSKTVVKEIWPLLDWVLTTQLPSVDVLGNNAKDIISNFKKQYTANFSELFIVLFKESFNLVVDWITDEPYWPNKINEYMQSKTKNNTIQSSFGSYYFSGADAVWISFIMNRIYKWELDIAE